MTEDQRTRRALDELADLFLTDTSVTADHSQSDPAQDKGDKPRPSHAEKQAGHNPSSQDELAGPDAMRLKPKVAARQQDEQSAHASHSQTREQQDDAPRLRLHRDDGGTSTAPANGAHDTTHDPLDAAVRSAIERGQARARQYGEPSTGWHDTEQFADASTAVAAPATAEAVLLGNLPGLSGPWLTQYGQWLAQQVGPVVLLHVDDYHIDAELIEPTDRPQRSDRVPPRQSQSDLIDRLEALTEPGPAQVRAVLMHSEASARPSALERLSAFDRWTLLSGADDAAVVAGYRTIKSLVEADAQIAHKHLGVMVVGSGEADAQAAGAKLTSATQPLLEAPGELVGSLHRMVPVNLSQLGRFGPTASLWPRLVQWLDQLDQAHAPVERDAQQPIAAMDEQGAADEMDADTAETSRYGDVDDAPVMEEAAAPSEPHAHESAATEPAADEEPGTDNEPDLATFLTTRDGAIAGGVALEARCPLQPKTQIVLDQDGRLHLLRRHASDADAQTSAIDGLRSAIVDLLAARKWVMEHVSLLQLTQRQCRFDEHAEPALHLFTDRADLATGLVARLGDTLRLHLLRHVHVGNASTWFCTPLH